MRLPHQPQSRKPPVAIGAWRAKKNEQFPGKRDEISKGSINIGFAEKRAFAATWTAPSAPALTVTSA